MLDEVPVYSSCYSPPPGPRPSPPPGQHPARPPNPPPGQCVAAPNITLLSSDAPGGLPGFTQTDSAAECQQRCKANDCCRAYTWHGRSTGSFFRNCYLITDPPDPWKWAQPYAGHFSGLCDHGAGPRPVSCNRVNDICRPASVVCAATNVSQVTGVIGTTSAASKALAGDGVVPVVTCLEHLLDLANDWPQWKAKSFGVAGSCNYSDPTSCVNTLDTTYNYPLWFGPWAAAIELDTTQDAGVDISKYTWKDAANMVVHAMADGEWGGVQFKVSGAAKAEGVGPQQDGNPILNFSHGGFQQARGATLSSKAWGKRGNRFYMEGAAEFLDAEGEWHFDQASRTLYMMPPAGVKLPPAPELLLTQTDTLLQFLGSSSDAGSRVEYLRFENLSFAFTSAQFFRPHEETSGGDYATHRSAAIKVENATALTFAGNEFAWIGGNGIFLSNSVRNTTVTASMFRFLGTSGVAVQGKTGAAMMDGRDGERMMAAHGRIADNGVRLPTNNLVSNNVFADYGIWDKQSACYHKALAPDNVFRDNVCFNSSRHGVNFQDGFGGGGVAEGNLFFNLNRETSDTTALNAWNRRNYVTSSDADPAVGILVPPRYNEWRRNLVLKRDYYGVRDGNGNGLRNDDGSSFYKHSNNVLVYAGLQFNGGTQIWSYNNLLIEGVWNLGPTPDAARHFNNTVVDNGKNIQNGGDCTGFWKSTKPGVAPGIYTGDFNLGVSNATGQGDVDWDTFYCGHSLAEWQAHTGQDVHSRHVTANGDGMYDSPTILKAARAMLWPDDQA